jgi:hypothetical protein
MLLRIRRGRFAKADRSVGTVGGWSGEASPREERVRAAEVILALSGDELGMGVPWSTTCNGRRSRCLGRTPVLTRSSLPDLLRLPAVLYGGAARWGTLVATSVRCLTSHLQLVADMDDIALQTVDLLELSH